MLKFFLLNKLFIISLNFFLIFAKIQFDFAIHKVQESGANCVLNIARNFFEEGSIVCVATSGLQNITNFRITKTTDVLILGKLMDEGKWTIMTKKGNIPYVHLRVIERVHNYILFLKSKAETDIILNLISNLPSWNPHAKFLVYMDRAQSDWLKLVAMYFEELWKHKVINVNIMAPDEALYIHRFFTWFPFEEGHCGKQHSKYVELATCNNSQIFQKKANMFPEKVPMNLNSCPVRIATIVWPPFILPPKQIIKDDIEDLTFEKGIEIEIIHTIAAQANFTAKFRSFEIPENWGTIYPNHSGTGMMGVLLRQEVDFAVGTLTPSSERHEYFDFTIQYTQDKTTWVVPEADIIPKWRSLVAIFHPNVWLVSMIVYAIVSLTTCLLGKSINSTQEYSMFRTLYGTSLSTWSTLVGSAPAIFPKSTRLRVFVFLWGLFSLHWYTAYTTCLISMLTTPQYQNPISSIEDILASGMEFGMTQPTTRYFLTENFANDKIGIQILKKYKLCKSAAPCLKRVAKERDFAVAVSRQYFEYVESNFIDATGKQLVRALSKNIVSPPVEMLLVKGNPLLQRIDLMLLRIIQAGLIDFWSKTIKVEISAESKEIMENLKQNDNQVLTLYHLQGAFMALGIGLILSFLCFLTEISLNYSQQSKKRY